MSLVNFVREKKCKFVDSKTFYHEIIRIIKVCLNSDDGKTEIISEKTLANISALKNKTRLRFLEEVQMLILLIYKNICEDDSKTLLKIMHLYVHTGILHLKDISLAEKLNELLNFNFKIPDDDLVSHAVRGNFGALVVLSPELTKSLESFVETKRDTSKSNNAWLNDKRLLPELKNVLLGQYTDFADQLELFCYQEMFNLTTEDSINKMKKVPILNFMITGNFEDVELTRNNLLNLILSIVFCNDVGLTTKRLINLFEDTFLEVQYSSVHEAMEILLFSPSASLVFPTIIMRYGFSFKGIYQIIKTMVAYDMKFFFYIVDYFHYLLDSREYEKALRVIFDFSVELETHSQTRLKYPLEFVVYLVNNIGLFGKEIDISFLKNPYNFFAVCIAFERYTVDNMLILIENEYFLHFIDTLIPVIINLRNEHLFLKLLIVFYNADKKNIAYNTKYKSIILEQLENL